MRQIKIPDYLGCFSWAFCLSALELAPCWSKHRAVKQSKNSNMTLKNRSRQITAKQSARLGAYLAAGLGASTIATSNVEAAIVVIDIGPTGFNIGGINGGLTSGTYVSRPSFPLNGGGTIRLFNNYQGYTGIAGVGGLEFAINGGNASPRNFALNASIGSSANFSGDLSYSGFKYNNNISTSFNSGGYMGFKTASSTNMYGWLQVTYNSKSSQFFILSGAYENTPGVAILAGDTGAVPEPSTWALSALLAGGAAFSVWRKRQKALKEAA